MSLILFHRFTPDAAKYELLVSDDQARILEQQLSVAIHPLLEHLLRTNQFLTNLQKVASGCLAENRLNVLRLLGQLLTPDYQVNISEHFVCLLDMFLQNVELGNQ